MMAPLHYVLPVPPSANRWWRNVNGRMVTSAAAREYKQKIPWLCRGRTMIAAPTPVKVSVRWYREIRSGDLDKRLGVVLDALQGVAYQNDSQVVELHAYRADGQEARIEVTVEAA